MVLREAKGEPDAEFVRFTKVGDKIEGTLVDMKPSDRYGSIYTIETKDGIKLLLGKDDLNRKMREVPEGSKVIIELVDILKTKNGNFLKLFKVMYDDGYVEIERVN